jgi:hypothetical protein
LQLEMAKILLHNVWHRHTQRGRKILICHRLLLRRVFKKTNQTVGEIWPIPRLVKAYRQLFALCHLSEIGQVRAHDGHPVSAGQMRDSAAARRRGIRHHGHGRTLKKMGQIVLLNVAREFNFRIPFPLFFERFDITACLRMIASRDDQPGVGHLRGDEVEGVDHQFQPFVSAPLPEGEDAVFGIATAREVRRLRPSRQNAV